MADGKVEIAVELEDKEAEKKLDEIGESAEKLGDKVKESSKETEKAESKYRKLTETITKQENELEELSGAYVQATVNFGKNSKEANELEGKISALSAELKANKSVIEEAEKAAKKAAGGLEDLGEGADKGGDGLGILDVALGNLVSGGISGFIGKVGEAIGSLVALADETREYREDMAKLDTAFKEGGHSTEAASQIYEDFYAILGESDRSVEAANHLAELTDNTEDLSKWSTIAAGVTAKFGDSLPLEGLTEAANETAKVGQTTGVLADALNWASKDSAVFKDALGGNKKAMAAFNKALKEGENVEDAFSAALSKMSTEQERSAAITNTLNGLYADAAGEYNKMTASTQAARRATAEMEAAQARLGTAFEPLATIATTAKTAFLNFAATMTENVTASIDKAKESATLLNTEQRALVENSLQAAEKLSALKLSADEAAVGIVSNSNYTKTLADELLRLADANGRVTDADKARVEFILGELNEALGTEYALTGNVISQYGKLKDSIYETIEAKKAQILLQQYETQYAEAVKNLAAQEEARATQAIALTEAIDNAEKAALHEKQVRAEAEKSILENSSRENVMAWHSKIEAAASASDQADIQLKKIQDKYNETDSAVESSLSAINAYEQASTAILSGETDKALEILNNYGKGFTSAATTASEAHEEELAALQNKVIATSIQYEKLKTEYEQKQGAMTDAQKKDMEKRIEAARKEAQDARAEYYKVGGDSVEGLVQGATDKDGNPTWNLAGKFKSFVENAIAAAKKAADINSPSKKFAWIGEMMMEGLSGGTEHGGKKAVEAVRKVGADMVKEGEKSADKQVKALESQLDRLNDVREEKNEKLSELDRKKNAKQAKALEQEIKLIDKRKKALQKDLEAAKEHQKVLTNFATNYEKQLTELNKLEADYSTKHQAIFDKLKTDSESAIANYQSTFESRVQSIKSSLGLFDLVEKKEEASGYAMTNALRSQVTELTKYNKALETLFSRNVSAAFYEEFSQLGVDYLPQLEAINKMTDKQLEDYVELWEKKTALASEAAEKELAGERGRLNAELVKLKDDALTEAETLKTEYNAAMLELLGEITTGMLNAGNAGIEALGETVSGYVETGAALMEGVADGMASKQSEIIQQAVTAVRRAIAAAKAEADIHSPSRVTKDEIGANLALGVAEGWEDKLATLRGSMTAGMSGTIDRLRETVSAENARYGYSRGAADTGFTELARAVNVQTAGLNSLASAQRGGSMRPIVLKLDKRTLGSAVVDVSGSETVRVGPKLVTGGVR